MRNLIKIAAIITFSFAYTVNAQQVVKKDTLSGTELSITMDSDVDAVITKMEENCNRTTKTDTGISNTTPKSNSPKIVVPNRPLSNAEICRQNPKILGYKIQLVVVKSNEEANEVKAYFRRRFPNLKAEVDASLRPNYKVLAGSYLTKQSAAGDLSRIRQYFNSAIPVQYRVFCVEAR